MRVSNFITTVIALASMGVFGSCQSDDEIAFKAQGDISLMQRSVDLDSLTQQQLDSLNYGIELIVDSSTAIVKRIAASGYSDSQMDTLSIGLMNGLFGLSELGAILDSIEIGRSYIRRIIGGDTCTTCNYTEGELIDVVKDMAILYRNDISTYNSTIGDPVKRKKFFGQNPNCALAFYVCLLGCTEITGGLGAAACVYVCACAFCETKPPGCPS